MDAGSNSTKIEATQEKRRAIQWLLGGGEDFITVCQNAELDPAYVREKARAAIKRGCVWRATSTTKSAPIAPVLPLRNTDRKVGLPFPLRHKSHTLARLETGFTVPLKTEKGIASHSVN